MFKTVGESVWAFDLEWVPDAATGRRWLGLPASTPEAEVIEAMWQAGGATEDDPRPYLKTPLCRIVSVAAVVRETAGSEGVRLSLRSMPKPGRGAMDEAELIGTFLDEAGRRRPQLVGFNSANADLPILLQRALALGISSPAFCRRPGKPWEGYDYFVRHQEGSVDLKDVLGGWGRSAPALAELAAASGIPGKLDVDGSQVVDLWLGGKVDEIVAYNECDALTTYLVWLRAAHLGGFVSSLEEEEDRVRELVTGEIEGGKEYLQRFLEAWEGEAPEPAGEPFVLVSSS